MYMCMYVCMCLYQGCTNSGLQDAVETTLCTMERIVVEILTMELALGHHCCAYNFKVTTYYWKSCTLDIYIYICVCVCVCVCVCEDN